MSTQAEEHDRFVQEIERDWDKAMQTPKSIIALVLFAFGGILIGLLLALYKFFAR